MAPGDEKKKKKKRRKRKKMEDDDFMIESANVAKKLHEKYGSKKVRFQLYQANNVFITILDC